MSPYPSDKQQRGKAVSPQQKKGVQRGSAGDRKRKAKVDERGRGGASRRRDPRPVSDVVGGRTFPGELSRYIIAGYENPRVFPGVPSTNADGQTKSKARSLSPVADKAPPFCPRAFRGTYPFFSPSALFITRRQR